MATFTEEILNDKLTVYSTIIIIIIIVIIIIIIIEKLKINKNIGNGLYHWCFPVNIAIFKRKPL